MASVYNFSYTILFFMGFSNLFGLFEINESHSISRKNVNNNNNNELIN